MLKNNFCCIPFIFLVSLALFFSSPLEGLAVGNKGLSSNDNSKSLVSGIDKTNPLVPKKGLPQNKLVAASNAGRTQAELSDADDEKEKRKKREGQVTFSKWVREDEAKIEKAKALEILENKKNKTFASSRDVTDQFKNLLLSNSDDATREFFIYISRNLFQLNFFPPTGVREKRFQEDQAQLVSDINSKRKPKIFGKQVYKE